MKKSEKLGLWLPEGSDPLEVSKLSENFETLDPLGSGVEILKEGSGVGGLFMVSKYYDQPIKNAVLCNGGNVSASTYPELTEVLGLHYGGNISSASLNAEYGITSSIGYPTAYNADRDIYIAISSTSLVLYQKNKAPKYTPSVTSIKSDAKGFAWILSFGNYVYASIKYGSSNQVIAAHYDIVTDKWVCDNNTSI